MLSVRSTAFAAVAAVALTAGPAAAKDFCVGPGSGCYGSIQQAIGVAAANAGHDRVLIGPGLWTTGNASASDDVTIEGSGDATILTQTSYGSGVGLPFTLSVAGAGAEVRNLRISLPSGAQPRGLALTNGATADGVTIDGAGATFGVGVVATGAARFSGAVDLPSTNTGAIVGAGSSVVDARIAGAPAMRVVAGGGGALVRRSTVIGRGSSVVAAESGALTIEDSLIDTRAGYAGAAISTFTNTAPGLHRVDVDNVTLLGHGDDNASYAIDARAYSASDVVAVAMRDSVVSNFGSHAIYRGGSGTSNVGLDHVDVFPASTPVEYGAGQLTTTAVTALDPGFAADGFTPAPGSPLIDAGTPGALGGNESATDLVGNPRIVAAACGDARRDLGAVEAVGACATAPPSDNQPAPAPEQPAHDAVAPVVTKVRLVHRRTVRFTVSEAARVTVRITRAHHRAIVVKRTVAAGQIRLRLKHALHRGRYRIRVAAVDAAGNRGIRTARARVA